MKDDKHLSEAKVTIRGEYYRHGSSTEFGVLGSFVETFTVADSTDYVGVIKYTMLDDRLAEKYPDFSSQSYFEVLDIERVSGSIPLVLSEMGRADLERYIILKDLDGKAPGIKKIDWGIYGDLASLRAAIETLESTPSIFKRLHAQELRQPRQKRYKATPIVNEEPKEKK